jgi:hypothetical protein
MYSSPNIIRDQSYKNEVGGAVARMVERCVQGFGG